MIGGNPAMNRYTPNIYGGIQTNSYMPQQTQPVYPQIYTKIVENKDILAVTDVPFGGYGLFPKGDFSEIYLKSWNSDGTTSIKTYCVTEAEPAPQIDKEKIASRLDDLEAKVNSLINSKAQASTPKEGGDRFDF